MRELDKGDLDQFNALLQYAFQVTTKELFETGWAQDEIKYAKRPILEEAYVIGWFYKDRLASMIVVYHMQVNVHDNIMDMGGITGVATYPEYAGRGLIHSLMRRVLDYMNKQQMPLSFLCPYSIPFYRKMGWEICSDQLTFNVKDVQLPKARPVPGMVERVSLDSEDYDSLGGLIIEHLDRLPEEGDEIITEDDIRLVVEKLDKNRIESVHVYLPQIKEKNN